MEDGLVQMPTGKELEKVLTGINPCCNGRWSRTIMKDFKMPTGKES